MNHLLAASLEHPGYWDLHIRQTDGCIVVHIGTYGWEVFTVHALEQGLPPVNSGEWSAPCDNLNSGIAAFYNDGPQDRVELESGAVLAILADRVIAIDAGGDVLGIAHLDAHPEV